MRAITSFYNKTRYFWRRLLIAFLTLVLVAVFGFLLIKLMPGNPVDTYADRKSVV